MPAHDMPAPAAADAALRLGNVTFDSGRLIACLVDRQGCARAAMARLVPVRHAIHPAAWAAALALHLALGLALLPLDAPPAPLGAPFTVEIGALGLAETAGEAATDLPEAVTDEPPTAEAPAPAWEPAPPVAPAEPAAAPQADVPQADARALTPTPPATRTARPPSPRRRTETPARPAAPPAAASPGPPPGVSAEGPARGVAASGAPGTAQGTDAPRLPPAYAAAIARLLQRALRYPPGARDAGIEGTAVVTFTIARDGTILAPRLERSSGESALDSEALALLRRVSPLPRLPDEVPGQAAGVVVPIAFHLR